MASITLILFDCMNWGDFMSSKNPLILSSEHKFKAQSNFIYLGTIGCLSHAMRHNEYIKDASHAFLLEVALTLIVGLRHAGTQITMEQETRER